MSGWSAGNPSFGPVPLVMGSVYGLRSFKFDKLGRLSSVTRNFIWKPGENLANCGGQGYDKHLLDDCTCGFYAFTNGESSVGTGDSPGIDGVIECFGRTVIGTHGTRSTKARVVALHMPHKNLHNRTFRWYQRHSIGIETGIPWRNVVVNGIIGGLIACFLTVSAVIMWNLVSIGLFSVAAILSVNAFYGLLAENSIDKPRVRYMAARMKGEEGVFDRMAALYPDAKIYTSKSKMKRDFKNKTIAPAIEETPTPETHEDFWEMRV